MLQESRRPKRIKVLVIWEGITIVSFKLKYQTPLSMINVCSLNYLDLHAVLWLESYLVKWPKTFIVVSHAREFLNTVCFVSLVLFQ